MDASILDLRYKMKEVLRALNRNEVVNILYHGKLKGTLQPCKKKSNKKVEDHPFFGMFPGDKSSIEETMNQLRGGRYRAL